MKYMGWSRQDFDRAYPEDIEAIWQLMQEEADARKGAAGDDELHVEL